MMAFWGKRRYICIAQWFNIKCSLTDGTLQDLYWRCSFPERSLLTAALPQMYTHVNTHLNTSHWAFVLLLKFAKPALWDIILVKCTPCPRIVNSNFCLAKHSFILSSDFLCTMPFNLGYITTLIHFHHFHLLLICIFPSYVSLSLTLWVS